MLVVLTRGVVKVVLDRLVGDAELLARLPCGRRDMKTTRASTHVLNRGGLGVRSPVDSL